MPQHHELHRGLSEGPQSDAGDRIDSANAGEARAVSLARASARLRWRCRRGMLELDLILLEFVERQYPKLPVPDRRTFERLLNVPDASLLAYLNGTTEATDGELRYIVQKIRQTTRL